MVRFLLPNYLSSLVLIFLGVLKITHSILIGSLTYGLLALFSAVFASFHKKHVLVTATVALELSSGTYSYITCCILLLPSYFQFAFNYWLLNLIVYSQKYADEATSFILGTNKIHMEISVKTHKAKVKIGLVLIDNWLEIFWHVL